MQGQHARPFSCQGRSRCRRNLDKNWDVDAVKKENVDLSAADGAGEADIGNSSETGDGDRTMWQLAKIAAFVRAVEDHHKVPSLLQRRTFYQIFGLKKGSSSL